MKLFKKEVYGIDMPRFDAEDFMVVCKDFGFKVNDLGGKSVATFEIEAPYRALNRLVNLYDWTGEVSGPYKR